VLEKEQRIANPARAALLYQLFLKFEAVRVVDAAKAPDGKRTSGVISAETRIRK
jgi:hypothetical protein